MKLVNETNKIPKIIHYCWFGNNPKPELITKCIESWRKYCPDYKIIEWNETNCSLFDNVFVKQAYENEKWAFVSDVIRLRVLFEHGGFYLDTDVEIFTENPFEQYREYKNVLVFENEQRIATGLFCGCQENSALIKLLLSSYDTLCFKGNAAQINTVVNLPIIVEQFPSLSWNNSTQIINNTYFASASEYNKKMHHYGTHSWLDDKIEHKPIKHTKFKQAIRSTRISNFLIKNAIGRKFLSLYEFMFYDLIDMGPLYFIKRFFSKSKRIIKSKLLKK